MTYSISRDGQNMGTYSEDGLGRQLMNGVLLPTDLAFVEDKQSWVPISELPKSEADQIAEFALKVESATPRAFVTPMIVAVNAAVFTVMIGAGAIGRIGSCPCRSNRWLPTRRFR